MKLFAHTCDEGEGFDKWVLLKFLNYKNYYLFALFLSRGTKLGDIPNQSFDIKLRVGKYTIALCLLGKDHFEENKKLPD